MEADIIERLHEAYCRGTGLALVLDMGRRHVWEEWLRGRDAAGQAFTVADLVLVIGWLKKQIRNGVPFSLSFSKLIGQTDRFEEYLAEARKANRIAARLPKVCEGRAEVLRQTGRMTKEQETKDQLSANVKTPDKVLPAEGKSWGEWCQEMRKKVDSC